MYVPTPSEQVLTLQRNEQLFHGDKRQKSTIVAIVSLIVITLLMFFAGKSKTLPCFLLVLVICAGYGFYFENHYYFPPVVAFFVVSGVFSLGIIVATFLSYHIKSIYPYIIDLTSMNMPREGMIFAFVCFTILSFIFSYVFCGAFFSAKSSRAARHVLLERERQRYTRSPTAPANVTVQSTQFDYVGSPSQMLYEVAE